MTPASVLKAIGKLPPELIALLIDLVRDLVTSDDPKAAITRAREVTAKGIAFQQAQRARRPKR